MSYNLLSVRDALLSAAVVLPAAGAVVYSAPLDLGAESTHHVTKSFDVKVDIPALAALADTKNLTVQLQDSADNASFANLGISATVTGAGGAGSAAAYLRFTLPVKVRQFVRVSLTLDAAGGNITGSSASFFLVF